MVRHRRRVRRRPQRDVHRRVDSRAKARTGSGSRRRPSTRWPKARITASLRLGCGGRSSTSLRRLGVERVDLYLAHAWDPDVPIAETRGASSRSSSPPGKIGAYGLSNVDGAQLREALAAGPFAAVQNSYSLLDREAEHEVLPLCAEHGLWFQVAQPAHGRLADRQVPARRAGARGLADDAALGPVRAPARRSRLRRARGARARAATPPPSRSRGCSRTSASRSSSGRAVLCSSGRRSPRSRIRLPQEERDALSDEFRLVPQS